MVTVNKYHQNDDFFFEFTVVVVVETLDGVRHVDEDESRRRVSQVSERSYDYQNKKNTDVSVQNSHAKATS